MSKTQHIARFDVRKLEKATKLDNGFLRAPVFATRSGVFRYLRADGTVLREYRPEAEVFSDQSMATLAGVPLTNRHPSKLVDSRNARKFTVGHVSDIVEREDNFVKTSVVVMDERVINEIENNGLREVSCGYTADLEFTPGITEDGEEYDAIQRNIRYNHLAVVDKGRAGPNVRLRLDSNAAIQEDALEYFNNPKPTEREDAMAKVMLDGAEYEVDAGAAAAFNSALHKLRQDGDKTKKELEDEKKASEEMKQKTDELQAKVDSLTEDLKKAKEDSLSEEQIQERVEARTKLLDAAKKHLKEDAEIAKMSDLEIKKAVIEAHCDSVDLSEKSEAYIEARFDHIIETAPEKKETKKDSKLRKTLSEMEKNRQDGDDTDPDVVREKSMNKDAEMWMKPIAGAAVKPTLGGEA